MARKASTASQSESLFTEKVKFIQIISVTYTHSDGEGQGSSVIALGDDGNVYQYRRGDINAWVPFNSTIFRKA